MKDAVIILGDLRTYKVEIDGKKTAMKGCFVIGAYDGKDFSGTETTARTMSWGRCLTTRKNFQKTYKGFI